MKKVIFCRYKLELQVCDGDSYANFVILDQDCINLIGVSVVELMNKMIEDGEDDPKCFPEDLDVMLGCTLAFKVKVQPKNRSSSVMKASNNLETIVFIRSKLESKMGKQSFHLPVCDSNNENESFPITTYESQTDVINKESSPTDICGSRMQSMAVGLIKSGSRGKNSPVPLQYVALVHNRKLQIRLKLDFMEISQFPNF
ncbi:Nucleic acid-binding [Vigna unguiculata]|uniref:Nucleic acid-binding n=1 Tax=Vigna unguiculata TaxID=3917 RepID=A0A4D6LUN0_VIGUN|nr:Nucleic acid-binding [Vigna unguiculata]